MKNFICLIVLLSVMSSVSFAGAYVSSEKYLIDTKPKPVLPPIVMHAPEKVIIEKQVEKQVSPQYGLGVGFLGDLPAGVYSRPDIKLFFGGGRSNGDSRLLFCGQGKLAEILGVPLHLSFALWPAAKDHQFGIAIGTEHYLTDNLSGQVNCYLAKMGNIDPDFLVVELGACLVLLK